MSVHQSKIAMLQSLRGHSSKAYKRQKQKIVPLTELERRPVDLNAEEMDLEEDGELSEELPPLPDAESQPPLPDAQTQPPPPEPAEPVPPGTDSPASPPDSIPPDHRGSPSLDDLRKQQELLLAALNASTTSVADDSLIDDIMALETTTCSADDSTTVCESPEPTTPTEDFATPLPATPMNSSKHSVSGTPLIQSVSPYSTIPVGANWSVGVSEIIDFENLADSTGKFEQMKSLIKRVRVAVKELNEEECEQ